MGYRITFARVKDVLGHTLYRYVGTFQRNQERSDSYVTQFDLVRTREDLPR